MTKNKKQLEKDKEIKEARDCILKAVGTYDNFCMLGIETIEAFQKMINDKKFRVADTTLSYRQVNHLDNTNVLKDTRKDKKRWRKFSLKELIFLSIVKELRKYGFRDEQLKPLRNAFFGKKNNELSDFAIGIVFIKFQMSLIINNENKVFFFDDMGLRILLGKSQKSYLKINLNEVVNEIWEKIGKDRIEYRTYEDIMASVIDDFDLDEKELEIMKLIRNKDYKSITIKRNNKEFIVKGEKTDKFSEKDLLKIIKEKDFGNINLVKRNGKVVNFKIEDTYKV
jgi:hypothetical protein